MADDCSSGRGYTLRKRKRAADGNEEAIAALLRLADTAGRIVVFSGSGLSANSGMSMFSTKNGLYERARQRFRIADGIKLFSYGFYRARRADVQAFFAQIYSEAQSSRAAPGHVAISQLHALGRLQRHYTLNIDGLSAVVGLDTWHREKNPGGATVEMHGNIRYVVCPACHHVEPLAGAVLSTLRAARPVRCGACGQDEMRFKVMLYGDEQGDCITPDDVFEQLDDDLAAADAVLWVGISFEQSASTEYFRRARHILASQGRLGAVTQVIINPSDEAYFNVASSMSKREDVRVLDVRGTSDDVLPRLVEHLHAARGTRPDAASAAAAAAAAAEAAARRRQRAAAEAAAAEAEAQATAAGGARGSSGGGGGGGGGSSRHAAPPQQALPPPQGGGGGGVSNGHDPAAVAAPAAAAAAVPVGVADLAAALLQQQQRQQQQQQQQQMVLLQALMQAGVSPQAIMAALLPPQLQHAPALQHPQQECSAQQLTLAAAAAASAAALSAQHQPAAGAAANGHGAPTAAPDAAAVPSDLPAPAAPAGAAAAASAAVAAADNDDSGGGGGGGGSGGGAAVQEAADADCKPEANGVNGGATSGSDGG